MPPLRYTPRRGYMEIEHDVDDAPVGDARISEQRRQVRGCVGADASPDAIAVMAYSGGGSCECSIAAGAWFDGQSLPTISPAACSAE